MVGLPSSDDGRGPLPRETKDHIFRFVGRLDLPVGNFKNPSGLDLSHFVSVPSVINYVMATPTEKLVFPGRLVAPTTAGVIAR